MPSFGSISQRPISSVGVANAAAAETVLFPQWFQSLSEPTRRLRRTSYFQEITADVKPVVTFSWMASLVELRLPLQRDRYKSVLAATSGLIELLPVFDSTIFAETNQSSGPTFRKTVLYQSQTRGGWGNDPITETDWFPDKWFNQTSEPVRKKPRSPYFQDFIFPDQQPIVSFSWFSPLSEPTKRVGLQTKFQQWLFYDSPAIAPVIYNPAEMGWFRSLNEPIKRVGLQTKFQQWLFYDSPAISTPSYNPAEMGWFNPFHDPKRFKKNLSVGLEQYFSLHPNPLVTFSYFQGLSEPKRFNTKLKAAWLPFSVSSTDVYPSPVVPPYVIYPFTGVDLIGAHEYFPFHNKDGLTSYMNKGGHHRKRYFPTDIERDDALVRKRLAITNPTTVQELDWDVYNFFDVSLNGDVTFVFSNPRDNSDFVILLTKDSNSNTRNITWPASLAWPDNDAFTYLAVSGETKLIRISYFGGRYRATLY